MPARAEYEYDPFKYLGHGMGVFQAIDYLWNLWGSSSPSDAYDPTNSKAVYAESLKNVTATYLANQHVNAANCYELLKSSNYFFDRKAEWAAKALYDAQTAAGQSHTYDRNYVLDNSGVSQNATAYVNQIVENYNSIFRGYDTLGANFVGTYDGMSWGVSLPMDGMGASQRLHSKDATGGEISFRAGLLITTTAGQNVIIPDGASLIIFSSGESTAGSVNVTDRSGAVVVQKTYTAGQVSYNPDVIVLNAGGTKAGGYNIALSSGFYCFTVAASKDVTSSGTLTPALMATHKVDGKDSIMGCFNYGSQKSVIKPILVWTQPDNYGGPNLHFYTQSSTGYNTPLTTMFNDIADATARTSMMLSEANSMAQAYFNSIVASGGGTILPSPDVVFPDPSQMANLTTEQITLVYFAYLNQLKDWYLNHTGTFDPSDVSVSSVAMDLIVRGSIKDASGNVLADNLTVFTPFNSLKELTLTVGEDVTLTQPGFAAIWGRASSIDGSFKANAGTYLELKSGYVLHIEQMFYKGQPVTTKTLDVTTLNYVIGPNANTPNSPQGIGDLQWLINHWYWFALILGVILCLAWVATRNTAIGVIGLILVAVGAIFWLINDASTTTGLLSGLFQIKRGGP